jgi:hypothetical protein
MPYTPPTANTPLTEAQRESVSTALDSIRSSLSFLVGLRPSDKQHLLKMGHKNRAFVEDAIKAGVNNPSMLPRSIEPESLQDKLTLFTQMRRERWGVGIETLMCGALPLAFRADVEGGVGILPLS